MVDQDNHSKPEMDMKADYSTLPNEILLKIFCYLKIDDVKNLNLVCKRWCTISSCDMLWEKFVPRYPEVQLPKAKTQKEIFQKLWSDSVKIGKERWFPNPLPSFVEYNISLQKYNENNIPTNIDDAYSLSKCMLFLRLNPLYPFTFNGVEDDDPVMLEILREITGKCGNVVRPDRESDKEGVHDGKSYIYFDNYIDRRFAMLAIMRYCFDYINASSLPVTTDGEWIDAEGHIKPQFSDAIILEKGMALTRNLFNQFRNIFIGNTDRITAYRVDYRNKNENRGLPYTRQMFVSDTAVVYCARRLFWVR